MNIKKRKRIYTHKVSASSTKENIGKLKPLTMKHVVFNNGPRVLL